MKERISGILYGPYFPVFILRELITKIQFIPQYLFSNELEKTSPNDG